MMSPQTSLDCIFTMQSFTFYLLDVEDHQGAIRQGRTAKLPICEQDIMNVGAINTIIRYTTVLIYPRVHPYGL